MLKVFGPISSVMPVVILIIPLYDTLRVFILRAKRGDSPFDPGRDHIHHILIGMGMGHRKTSLTLYGMSSYYRDYVSVSMWNVNILVLFSVLLAIVVLPGTGFKRMVKGWFSKSSPLAPEPSFNALSSKTKEKRFQIRLVNFRYCLKLSKLYSRNFFSVSLACVLIGTLTF